MLADIRKFLDKHLSPAGAAPEKLTGTLGTARAAGAAAMCRAISVSTGETNWTALEPETL